MHLQGLTSPQLDYVTEAHGYRTKLQCDAASEAPDGDGPFSINPPKSYGLCGGLSVIQVGSKVIPLAYRPPYWPAWMNGYMASPVGEPDCFYDTLEEEAAPVIGFTEELASALTWRIAQQSANLDPELYSLSTPTGINDVDFLVKNCNCYRALKFPRYQEQFKFISTRLYYD